MRKILTSLVIATLALLQFVVFPSNAGADQWVPNNGFNPNVMGVNIVNTFFNTGEGASKLISLSGSVDYAPGSTASMPNETLCSGLTSTGACNFASPGVGLDGIILLPVCTSSTQTNCVTSMALGTSASSMQPGTFVSMTTGPTIDADPAHGLPAGSTIGLWTDPVVNAGGTNTYATYAMLHVGYNSTANHYMLSSLSALIIPYKKGSGNYSAPIVKQFTDPSNGRLAVSNDGQSIGCAWTSAGECGVIQDFTAGTYASMGIRLTTQIGGWFQGRMQNPSLSVSSFDSQSNLITVTGQSVDVPVLNVSVPTSNASPAIKAFYANISGAGVININANYSNAFTAVDAFRDAANNSSTAVINIWSFGSYSASGNACLTNTSAILGVVTTNSMVFSPTVPIFSNGVLDYQVAGMHYLPDGKTPVGGVYDMVMADSVARCLYGFSNSPISATISISENSAGEKNVATTSVSDVGGWLHLAAYNFQFSNPTITAKLTQAAPVIIVAPAKKTSITCVNIKNKKLIKKITAVKPVCPSGYKKV